MSSGSEMGRGKMPAKPKKSYGLDTATGRMQAASMAKKAASKASKKAQVGARKAKQAITGKSGANPSTGKAQKGGNPTPSKAMQLLKRVRKGLSN